MNTNEKKEFLDKIGAKDINDFPYEIANQETINGLIGSGMDYFFLIESPNQFAFFSDSYLDSIDKEACEKAFTKTQASIYQLNDDTSFEEASKKSKALNATVGE